MKCDTFRQWKWLREAMACGCIVLVVLSVGCGRSEAPEQEAADAEADPQELEQTMFRFEQQFGQLVEGKADAEQLLGEMAAFVERHPEYYEARRLYAQALHVDRRFESAYEEFETAVELNPDDAELRLLVGDMAMQMGEYERAQRHYSRGTDLEPGNQRFQVRLAQSLIEQQRFDEARRLLLEALRRDSSLHSAHLGLADLYARQNRQELALEHIDRAIELVPDDDARRRVTYVLRQSALLRRANRPEDALAVLRDLPAEQQIQITIAQAMARCWVMLGQPERAAEHYDYILSRDPSDDIAAAEAANWHIRAGQFDEARQRLEVLRRLNPRSPALPRLQEVLAEATTGPADEE